ncbi:hypothetical protein FACS1894196_3980 [Clostridia bacterium]|nr:hypothetical protein FACS1894196_3980 [Clostridia bacterium]
MDKTKDISQAEWYAAQTIENGWSVNILALQIDSNLYEGYDNWRRTVHVTYMYGIGIFVPYCIG